MAINVQRPMPAGGILPFPQAKQRFRNTMRSAKAQQLLLDTVLNNMSQAVLIDRKSVV